MPKQHNPATSAAAGAAPAQQQQQQQPPSSPSEGEGQAEPEVTPQDVEEAYQRKLKLAQELLDTINRVSAVQSYWADELQNMYRQEAEEDERAKEMFMRSMLDEVEFLSNPRFLHWMAQRNAALTEGGEKEQLPEQQQQQQGEKGGGSGVGQEGIREWFHNDDLLALTPFLCTVPCPSAKLTAEGRSAVEREVDSFGFEKASGFLLEFHSPEATPSASNDNGEEEAAEHRSLTQHLEVLRMMQTNNPLRTGKDVTSLFDASACDFTAAVSQALSATPCLFINDQDEFGCTLSASGAQQGRTACCAVLEGVVFVVKGVPLAVQLETCRMNAAAKKHQQQEGSNNNSEQSQCAADATLSILSRLAQSVAVFHSDHVTQHLHQRTYAMKLRFQLNSNKKNGPVSISCRLLNVGAFEAHNYDAFTWADIVGLIVVMHSSASSSSSSKYEAMPVVRCTKACGADVAALAACCSSWPGEVELSANGVNVPVVAAVAAAPQKAVACEGAAQQDQEAAQQDQGAAQQDQGAAQQDQGAAQQDQGAHGKEEEEAVVVVVAKTVVARHDEDPTTANPSASDHTNLVAGVAAVSALSAAVLTASALLLVGRGKT